MRGIELGAYRVFSAASALLSACYLWPPGPVRFAHVLVLLLVAELAAGRVPPDPMI